MKKTGYAAKNRYAFWVSTYQKARETRISHEKSTNDISNIVNVFTISSTIRTTSVIQWQLKYDSRDFESKQVHYQQVRYQQK